jgi:hypothetical protein
LTAISGRRLFLWLVALWILLALLARQRTPFTALSIPSASAAATASPATTTLFASAALRTLLPLLPTLLGLPPATARLALGPLTVSTPSGGGGHRRSVALASAVATSATATCAATATTATRLVAALGHVELFAVLQCRLAQRCTDLGLARTDPEKAGARVMEDLYLDTVARHAELVESDLDRLVDGYALRFETGGHGEAPRTSTCW